MFRFLAGHRIQLMLFVFVFTAGIDRCFAQANGQAGGQTSTAPDQQIPPAVAKKLEAMEARIEQLEAELKARPAAAQPEQPKVVATAWSTSAPATTSTIPAVPSTQVIAQVPS